MKTKATDDQISTCKEIAMSTRYSDQIRDIVNETFEITCYMFPLEDWEIEDGAVLTEPGGKLRSIVRFDGAAEGAMVINPSPELLESMACNMLGIDRADQEQKKGALCEIANIICGNTVPLFARDKNICYIRPPRIAEPGEDTDQTFAGMTKETMQVNLDEGAAQITIYYSEEEQF